MASELLFELGTQTVERILHAWHSPHCNTSQTILYINAIIFVHRKNLLKFFARYYKQATKLDESSVLALSGIISCQLRERQFDVAREQLDFLKEIQASPGATGGASANNKSEILYMSAVLGRQTG